MGPSADRKNEIKPDDEFLSVAATDAKRITEYLLLFFYFIHSFHFSFACHCLFISDDVLSISLSHTHNLNNKTHLHVAHTWSEVS